VYDLERPLCLVSIIIVDAKEIVMSVAMTFFYQFMLTSRYERHQSNYNFDLIVKLVTSVYTDGDCFCSFFSSISISYDAIIRIR
jgi:hypothetical protein